MKSLSPLDISFDRNRNLNVCVTMTGTQHVFGTGKQGYRFRDHFDFDGETWLLRFQAFVTQDRTDTTLGLLTDAPEPKYSAASASSLSPMRPRAGRFTLAELKEATLAKREELKAGWHLAAVSAGIKGWFEMARVRQLPKGAMGSFASFNVVLNDVLYLGQFHLSKEIQPMVRPIAWDHSKGAKAGLPSLGKRR